MSKNSTPIKYGAAGLAAVVLAFGAYSLGNSTSNNGTSATANAAQSGQVQPGQLPQNGQGRPGFGTPATGSEAAKAQAAALARYKGTAERVMKLADGSYVVHEMTSSGGESRVLVSKDFKVTGTQQGGPGAGRAPGSPPPSSGAQSSNGSSS